MDIPSAPSPEQQPSAPTPPPSVPPPVVPPPPVSSSVPPAPGMPAPKKKMPVWVTIILVILLLIALGVVASGAALFFAIRHVATPENIKAVTTLAETAAEHDPQKECSWSSFSQVIHTTLPEGKVDTYTVENGILKKDGKEIGYGQYAFCTQGALFTVYAAKIFPGYNTEGRWFQFGTDEYPMQMKIVLFEEDGVKYMLNETRSLYSDYQLDAGGYGAAIGVDQVIRRAEGGFVTSVLSGSFDGKDFKLTQDFRDLVQKEKITGWTAEYR